MVFFLLAVDAKSYLIEQDHGDEIVNIIRNVFAGEPGLINKYP